MKFGTHVPLDVQTDYGSFSHSLKIQTKRVVFLKKIKTLDQPFPNLKKTNWHVRSCM